LIESCAVVGVLLSQAHDIGLELAHVVHGSEGFIGEGIHDEAEQHCQEQNRQSEVAEPAVEDIEDLEGGLGDKVEPAEVHGEVKVCNVEVIFYGFEVIESFGAGEGVAGVGCALLWGEALGWCGVVALVLLSFVDVDVAGVDGLVGMGHQGGQPVFIGEAEPAAGVGEGIFVVFDGVVI